jgi:hypothetical protein
MFNCILNNITNLTHNICYWVKLKSLNFNENKLNKFFDDFIHHQYVYGVKECINKYDINLEENNWDYKLVDLANNNKNFADILLNDQLQHPQIEKVKELYEKYQNSEIIVANQENIIIAIHPNDDKQIITDSEEQQDKAEFKEMVDYIDHTHNKPIAKLTNENGENTYFFTKIKEKLSADFSDVEEIQPAEYVIALNTQQDYNFN